MLVLDCGCSQEKPFRGYAPEDAYLPGSSYPYYGSENKWDRRFFTKAIKHLYNRRGQRQMLDIVEGRPEEAARYCRELLASDPHDLESLFNLAAAQTQMKDLEGAMETVKRAVDSGLPFQRFLAGPRDVLRPLTESPPFKSYAAGRRTQLTHGPMLGCVTDRSARFWVRTVDEVPVQVVARPSKRSTTQVRSELRRTEAVNDYTTVVEVQGLQPDTPYNYDVILDGRTPLKPQSLAFRTYPGVGKQAKFQVGFGGGAGYIPSNERMWTLIRSHDPLAFLFLGDNVYIDMPQELNGLHYYTYYRRQSRPEFRALTASTSVYAVWDDHDCAIDDVWMGPYKDKPSWKMSMWRLFRQNWNNPGYGDPEWPGVWFQFSIGDVDFFMLECRFYRTNPYSEGATMLGPVQKAWLLDQLRRSKGRFKVLAATVPWTFESKGGAKDTWNGFRRERDEIFDFLAENKIDGVILLSADRHRSEAWRNERPNGYPLYEFESSRLTNEAVHELVPGALFGYNQKQSFGLLTFDTNQPDPTVTYRIVSIDNEVIHSMTLKRSEISHSR